MVSTPKYRSENDPYNGVEEADIRPSYIARQLSEAEQGASGKQSGDQPSLSSKLADSLRNSEQNQRSSSLGGNSRHPSSASRNPFSNAFHNATGSKNPFKRGGKTPSNFAKRLIPSTSIVGTLVAFCALIFGAFSTVGTQVSTLFTQATDIEFSSYHMRNIRLFKYMMDGGNQIGISNFTRKYKTFTPFLQKRLAKNGIEVGRVDADGNFHNQLISTGSTVLKYNDEIISASDFQLKFASDSGFRDAYTNAKRGRIAGYFDNAADRFYQRLGLSRNIFEQFKSTCDEESEMEAVREFVNTKVTGVDSKIETARHEYNEETQQDEIKRNGDVTDTTKIQGDAETKARTMVNEISGKVSTAGNVVCTGLRIANLAAITASAMQIYRSIAYFHSLAEPDSKTRAGFGNESGNNQINNKLTEVVTTEVDVTDSSGNTTKQSVTGSMLDAPIMKLVLGNTFVKPIDNVPYAIDTITKSVQTIAVGTGVTTTVCDGAMAASAIVSLAALAVPGGALAKIVIGAVAQAVGGIVMTLAISSIIEAIVPRLARLFIDENYFDNVAGVVAGAEYGNGAEQSNFRKAQNASAEMPASADRIDAQNKNLVIALRDEAATDRANRSPFDITSKNTFLGSLVSRFSFATFSHSLGSALASTRNILANSIASLTPAANAASQDLVYTSQYQDCSYMEGAACSINGTPIVARDFSTIDVSPDDPTYQAVILPNLDFNGSYHNSSPRSFSSVSVPSANFEDYSIKEDSELAKFINFCANRESPWGVQDANILNALQTDGGVVINNLPIVNDILDVVNAAENLENMGWATGTNCLNSPSNPRWDNEMKYYQLYVEDMRILDGMDESDSNSNPVLAYESAYEAKHPVDTTYEGTLARISGNTKADIAFLLEFARYSDYVANYDYSSRIALGSAEKPTQTINLEQSNNTPVIVAIYRATPIFIIDKRNYLI